MAKNVHDHVALNLLKPISPDINPMCYYVWEVFYTDYNSYQHNTVATLRAAVVYAMANIPNIHVIVAYSQFRRRVDAVIAAGGGIHE